MLRSQSSVAASAMPTPMSSGLRKGTCGSGAAEPSEAMLATSVQSHRPAAITAAALSR